MQGQGPTPNGSAAARQEHAGVLAQSGPPGARSTGASPDDPFVARLRVLFETAAQAQAAPDEAALMAAVAAGLNRVGFSAHLDLLEHAEHAEDAAGGMGNLVLRHAALLPAALHPAVERRLGRPLVGIELDPEAPPYGAVLRRGEVVWEPDAGAWLAQALPWLDRGAVRVLGRMRGVGQGVCAPITDGAAVLGALSVWGEVVTEADLPTIALLGRHAGGALSGLRLRRRELERARLGGALLVARTVAHEINNALSPVAGFAELLALAPEVAQVPRLTTFARLIGEGAQRATQAVARLQRIIVLEETESPLGPDRPVLDLDRSAPAP